MSTDQQEKQIPGWIGVDLDGTLAYYDKWRGPEHIGAPLPLMARRVAEWLEQGVRVKIFTARVSHDGSPDRVRDATDALAAIQRWCLRHFGQVLPVTCQKDFAMLELWDDRAVQVEHNTGRPVGYSTRGNTPIARPAPVAGETT